MSRKILIVEDEPSMSQGLRDNLEFEGYQVDVANNGAAGLGKIVSETYDLVVMDVMMPQMSGLEVCKKVRDLGIAVPVILLTAKSEEIDKVLGLEFGADDYITKPFSLRELLARIKAVLRRNGPVVKGNDVCTIGKLTFNFASYKAEDGNGPVKMSHKEYAIVKYLFQRKNEIVSRNNLLENVWGYEETPTTRTVDNFIVKLRHKIETDPNAPKIILTVHGTGYTLVYP
jgi:DNA-binding response OmpR family regulator